MDAPLPPGYVRATLARRADVAPGLATFWLALERPVPFRPGQYVTLALPEAPPGKKWVRRAYSVLSAPHEALLELFVEHVEGGALTPSLFALAEGATVAVRGRAAGHFVRDEACARHVCVATVTGIAPFLSMLRAHAARPDARPADRFLIFYGASLSPELGPYAGELTRLAADPRPGSGWLTAVPTLSRPWLEPGWEGEVGRVGDVLRKHLDAQGWHPEETAGYACGNPQMVSHARGVLARWGVPEGHLHDELYYTEASVPTSPAPPLAPPPAGLAEASPRPPGLRPGEIKLKTAPRSP